MAASDPLFAPHDRGPITARSLTTNQLTGSLAVSGIAPLETMLDHCFADPTLLVQALTHPSMGQERARQKGGGQRHTRKTNYERLEFLGDRVLGLVIAEKLLEMFPHEAEGALARRHAQLVRRETLANVARQIGLGAHIRLSGEEPGTRENANLLADSCEAVIAALYLDGGLPTAANFISRYWEASIRSETKPPKDAKTALQEWTLARGDPMPIYTLIGNEGPSHLPVFTVRVTAGGLNAEAAAGSKRAAETDAARLLLQQLAQLPGYRP